MKILYVNDSGRAINPTTVEGQVEGGIAQSVGYCLTEDYVINKETGVLESDNFTTYKIPSTLDMPETEVILYEEPVPSGPFGAKGAGHGTMVGCQSGHSKCHLRRCWRFHNRHAGNTGEDFRSPEKTTSGGWKECSSSL